MFAQSSEHAYFGRAAIAAGPTPFSQPREQPFDPAPRPYFVDCNGNAPAFMPSHDLLRLLAALPHTAGAKLTNMQMAALDVAIARTRPKAGSHKLDYRVSVPFFGKRYYFVVKGGEERRSQDRIAKEGLNAPWRVSIAYTVLMGVIATTGLMAVIVLLYLLKSIMGIDVYEDHSMLHNLFYGSTG